MRPTPWILGESGTVIFDANNVPIVGCVDRETAEWIVSIANQQEDENAKAKYELP